MRPWTWRPSAAESMSRTPSRRYPLFHECCATDVHAVSADMPPSVSVAGPDLTATRFGQVWSVLASLACPWTAVIGLVPATRTRAQWGRESRLALTRASGSRSPRAWHSAERLCDAAARINAPVAAVDTHVLDVRDHAAVDAFAGMLRQRHGGVDIVLSNAAARLTPDTPDRADRASRSRWPPDATTQVQQYMKQLPAPPTGGRGT